MKRKILLLLTVIFISGFTAKAQVSKAKKSTTKRKTTMTKTAVSKTSLPAPAII
jgi:hypothetical protein